MPRLSPRSGRKADGTGPTAGEGGGGASGTGGAHPQTTSSPKLVPKLSPKVAAKVPKQANPGALPTSAASTDATSGQTSQLSPKTGQSSPITGQKEAGSSSSNDMAGKVLFPESPKLHLLSLLGVLIPHMKYTQEETRMESLRWLMWLHQQLPKRVSGVFTLLFVKI